MRPSARRWSAGDVVELDLPLEVRLMEAHPAVEACRNRVAVMRGPVVYCFEALKDQDGERLWNDGVFLPENVSFTPRHDKCLPGRRHRADRQGADRRRPRRFHATECRRTRPRSTADWGRYALSQTHAASTDRRRPAARVDITLIPYFAWANRGPSFMEVWIPLVR